MQFRHIMHFFRMRTAELLHCVVWHRSFLFECRWSLKIDKQKSHAVPLNVCPDWWVQCGLWCMIVIAHALSMRGSSKIEPIKRARNKWSMNLHISFGTSVYTDCNNAWFSLKKKKKKKKSTSILASRNAQLHILAFFFVCFWIEGSKVK